jgi:hypothetical protein
MEKPDIETLLNKNPNIDRETLRRYLEEFVQIVLKPRRRGNTSPYSGRRLTPATKTNWTAAPRAQRSHYPAI